MVHRGQLNWFNCQEHRTLHLSTDTRVFVFPFGDTGTLRNVMSASVADLALCPGLGEKKVRRLHEVFTGRLS
jgi:hypothetical protein